MTIKTVTRINTVQTAAAISSASFVAGCIMMVFILPLGLWSQMINDVMSFLITLVGMPLSLWFNGYVFTVMICGLYNVASRYLNIGITYETREVAGK